MVAVKETSKGGRAMSAAFVVTMSGPDRPGLVNRLSDVAAALGANWTESRFLRLGGWFAGVAMIKIADQDADSLAERIAALEDGVLHVTVERAHRDAAAEVEELACLGIEAVGPDRAGVVRDLSAAMTGLGVSIDELATETEDASMAGGRIFQVVAALRLPEGVTEDRALAAARDAIPDFIVDETPQD
jgi:glycine cleavage system regulatory protein